MIAIIAAVARNLAIGKNNDLLCHIPGDLKRFKCLTLGHTVVMGRHTLESLPNGAALPNRRNIVITSSPETLPADCLPARSVNEALRLASNDDKVFIIGGGSVYKQTLAQADHLFLTWINHDFEADTFFPEINFDEWHETFREEHPATESCPYPFAFIDYELK
jgi:dihydrofolate reductase